MNGLWGWLPAMDPPAFEYAGPAPGGPMSKCAGATGALLEQITQMIEPVPKAPKVHPAVPVLRENWLFPVPVTLTRLTVGLFIVPPATPVLKVIPLSN